MAMSQDQFDALVAELEDLAEQNPGLYKLRLGAFASLGYLYIIGVLAVLLGVVAALAFFVIGSGSGGSALLKLGIPVIVLVGVVVRALRVRIDAPTGFELKPAERPRLFATIDEVRRAAKAPPAHVVLMTGELNAAIVQVPKLGLLGWQKNHLILGLPLMQLMTLDEFKAVLAHEFGHLSGAHGRFGAWIYRIREGWARLNERLQQEKHWGSFLFVPFFGWFAPKFAAWSFVQARAQEYEADRVAAESIGAKPLAHALIRLDLKSRELDQDFWPGIYSRTAQESTPLASPFTHLTGSERRGFLPEATGHLSQALARRTDTADTHPCLKERISALRQPATIPPPLEKSAAEEIFGGALPFITEHFDDEWRRHVGPWWKQRHEHIRNGLERLAAFRKRQAAELDDDECLEYGNLTEEFDGPESAYPIYLALARRPSQPLGARFAIGRLLLRKHDERGKQVIDRIMSKHPDTVIAGCKLIVPYLRAVGREAEARAYTDRYWQARNADAGDQPSEIRASA